MRKIEFENHEYELVVNYKDCFDMEETTSLFTDYFREFDYVFGDYSYGKLRLKGFYDSKNKKVSALNNYDNINNYIKDFCPYECKYFILKKVN